MSRKKEVSCLLFIVLLVALCTATTPTTPSSKSIAESSQIAQQKFNALQDVAERSPNHLINVNLTTYVQYLAIPPRPFHAFVYFTAAPKFCAVCAQMDRQVDLLANSVYQSRRTHPTNPPIFITKFTLSRESPQDLALAQKLGVTHLPYVALLSPDMSPLPSDDLPPETLIKPHSKKELYPMQTGQWDAASLAAFIELRAKAQIDITLHWYETPLAGRIMKYAILASGAFLIFRTLRSLALQWGRYAVFAALCALFVFYSLAGGTFIWVHNVPMVGMDPRTYAPTFFLFGRGHQVQLGAEGIIMALTFFGFSFAIIGLYHYPARSGKASLFAFLLVLAMFFAQSIYRGKTGW